MNIELSGFITSIVQSSLCLGLRKPKDSTGLAPPSVSLLWCFFLFTLLGEKSPFTKKGGGVPGSKGLFVLIFNFRLLFQAEFERF